MSGGLARAYDEAKARLARKQVLLLRIELVKERFVLTAAAFELVVADFYYCTCLSDGPLVIMWAGGWHTQAASFRHGEGTLTRKVGARWNARDRPSAVARRPQVDLCRTARLCDTWAPTLAPLLVPGQSSSSARLTPGWRN